jgi:hypothetical protein
MGHGEGDEAQLGESDESLFFNILKDDKIRFVKH